MSDLITEPTNPAQTSPVRRVRYLVPAVILVAVLVALGVFVALRLRANRETVADNAQVVDLASCELITASMLEEEYGIRIRLIGVTAAGGMVDFRYKIIDADKAEALLNGHGGSMPILVAEDTGAQLLPPDEMMHSPTIEDDRLVFILYSNSNNAIKPGTPVSVVFGDMRIRAMPAQ
jgi:hypothetical protein